jgi:hypothetical protein
MDLREVMLDTDLSDDEDADLFGGGNLSSIHNSVMEHDTGNDWMGRCSSFWRDWRVKRFVGVLIAIVVLLSIVMIAVGSSKLGGDTDPSLLPWIGVIVGLLLLIVSLVVGMLMFRGDCLNRVDHL